MESHLPRYKLLCSQRLLIAIVGFIGSFQLYSMRMNLSVGIICMTNHTAVEMMDNSSKVVNKSIISPCQMQNSTSYKDGPYPFDKETRGMILGVFFWGYLISQIPAGILVARFSVKWILFAFMLVASISVLIFPWAATGGVWMLVALRVISGIASGVWFPCMHQLWSRWAPPKERSFLVGFCYSGLHLGNALTLPIAGLLCEYSFLGGWPSVFYISGIFGILWCLAWAFLIHDSPDKSPRISNNEKKYINSSLHGQVQRDNKEVSFRDLPWLSILKSKPFWAIAVINVTFDWNGYTFITSTPTYMKDVLRFNMAHNGFVSAAPYVGMGLSQFFFIAMCDLFERKKWLGVTGIRKMMCSFGMLTPAVIIIILGYLQCQMRILAVVLLTFGLSATSALFVGAFVNHVDIAPQYAGLLFGLTNTMGSFTGFFSSYFVGAVTKNDTLFEWRLVFFVCAGLYIFGAIFYLIFGSGKIQDWAIQKDNAQEIRIMDDSDLKEKDGSYLQEGEKI